jgi:hypothetical protein
MPNASENFYAQQRAALRELATLYRQFSDLYTKQRLLVAERRGIGRQILTRPKPEVLEGLRVQHMEISGQLVAVRLELEDLHAQTKELQLAYELQRRTGLQFGLGDGQGEA